MLKVVRVGQVKSGLAGLEGWAKMIEVEVGEAKKIQITSNFITKTSFAMPNLTLPYKTQPLTNATSPRITKPKPCNRYLDLILILNTISSQEKGGK